MNDLISVIVPVYNMEEYLNKCIDSILKQSYLNIEVLLIDDGSTDRSKDICLSYEKMDKRVKYYYKDNGGLSSARNFGIKKCKGKYIGFVDSDDVIHENMFKILYENLIDTKSDLSICEVCRFNDEPVYTFSDEKTLYNKEEVLRIILEDKKICNFAVNKLYKKKLLKGIEFPIGKYQEDVGTIYKYIMCCNNIVYCDSKLYGYYSRENSISKKLTSKFIYDYFDAIDVRANDLKEFNLYEYVKLNRVNVIMGLFIDLSVNKYLLKDNELNKFMNDKLIELKKLYKEVKWLNSKKHNLMIMVLVFNKNLFMFLMGIYLKIK